MCRPSGHRIPGRLLTDSISVTNNQKTINAIAYQIVNCLVGESKIRMGWFTSTTISGITAFVNSVIHLGCIIVMLIELDSDNEFITLAVFRQINQIKNTTGVDLTEWLKSKVKIPSKFSNNQSNNALLDWIDYDDRLRRLIMIINHEDWSLSLSWETENLGFMTSDCVTTWLLLLDPEHRLPCLNSLRLLTNKQNFLFFTHPPLLQ